MKRSLTSSTVPSRSRMTSASCRPSMTARRHDASWVRARGALEVARDPGPQLEHRERLDEVVVGAGSEGGARLVVTGPRRQQHDGTPRRAGSRADGVDEAVAVEHRHHDVGRARGRACSRRTASRAAAPSVTSSTSYCVAEHVAQVGAQVGVVLGHDEPGATRRRAAAAHERRTGADPVGCCQVCTSRRKSSTRRGVIAEDGADAPRAGAGGARAGSRTVKVLPTPDLAGQGRRCRPSAR